MKELLKGVGSVALGTFAGAGLAAISFLAIEVLMPPASHVREIHNNTQQTNQSAGLSHISTTPV